MDDQFKAYTARLNTPEFKAYIEALEKLVLKMGSIEDGTELGEYILDMLALGIANSIHLSDLANPDLTLEGRKEITNEISKGLQRMLSGTMLTPKEPSFGFNGPMGSA